MWNFAVSAATVFAATFEPKLHIHGYFFGNTHMSACKEIGKIKKSREKHHWSSSAFLQIMVRNSGTFKIFDVAIRAVRHTIYSMN